MGDSRRGRSGEGKHVKVVKQRSRNSSQYYSKTDMCPSQRKEERDVTSSDLDEPITNADVSANWYEDGEEEVCILFGSISAENHFAVFPPVYSQRLHFQQLFLCRLLVNFFFLIQNITLSTSPLALQICASQALKTVQQQRSSSAKQTHTRPSSRGKKSSSHTPVSNRYSKRGSSSGYDSSSLPRYHKRSPSRGDGATTKEMASKYLGKKWPLSSAKPAQKRGGSMLSRKGDNHADMYGDLAFREMSASYDDLSDMGGSASYSENPLKKSAFPCKYFAMNRCTKGQQCPFSHTAEYTHPQNHYSIASTSYEDVPPGACLDWFYSGTCVNGPHCPMLHYIMGQDFDEYEEEEEEEEEEETARPVTVCSNWLQGRCRNGKACNFKHMTTTDETDEADKPDLLNMVKQGAGKIASTVTAPIQALREKVNSLRDELAEDQKHLLTRTLQMVLGRLSEGERDTLLGLPQAVLGLTRFRSVLIKRTIKYAFDACDLEAIESLSRWEDELELHMPEPPYDETFSKFFEKNLCQHYVEIVRCMLASPLCRLRSDWLLQVYTNFS